MITLNFDESKGEILIPYSRRDKITASSDGIQLELSRIELVPGKRKKYLAIDLFFMLKNAGNEPIKIKINSVASSFKKIRGKGKGGIIRLNVTEEKEFVISLDPDILLAKKIDELIVDVLNASTKKKAIILSAKIPIKVKEISDTRSDLEDNASFEDDEQDLSKQPASSFFGNTLNGDKTLESTRLKSSLSPVVSGSFFELEEEAREEVEKWWEEDALTIRARYEMILFKALCFFEISEFEELLKNELAMKKVTRTLDELHGIKPIFEIPKIVPFKLDGYTIKIIDPNWMVKVKNMLLEQWKGRKYLAGYRTVLKWRTLMNFIRLLEFIYREINGAVSEVNINGIKISAKQLMSLIQDGCNIDVEHEILESRLYKYQDPKYLIEITLDDDPDRINPLEFSNEQKLFKPLIAELQANIHSERVKIEKEENATSEFFKVARALGMDSSQVLSVDRIFNNTRLTARFLEYLAWVAALILLLEKNILKIKDIPRKLLVHWFTFKTTYITFVGSFEKHVHLSSFVNPERALSLLVPSLKFLYPRENNKEKIKILKLLDEFRESIEKLPSSDNLENALNKVLDLVYE